MHSRRLGSRLAPGTQKNKAAYAAACTSAERRVTVASKVQLDELLGHMVYDKRTSGFAGRAVMPDFGPLGLERGDRLGPSPLCPDIGGLDRRVDFPFDLVFWRSGANVLTKHRNPLFAPGTHVYPDLLRVDEMHTMHLGVFALFAAHSLWAVIEADVWGLGGDSAADARRPQNALRMRHELLSWYKYEKRTNPGKTLYQLSDFH